MRKNRLRTDRENDERFDFGADDTVGAARYVAPAHDGNAFDALPQAQLFRSTPQNEKALRYGAHLNLDDFAYKSAVAVGQTTGTWGTALAASGIAAEALPKLVGASILGAVQDQARRIPFSVNTPAVTTAPTASFVGHGKAKPLAAAALATVALLPTKIVSHLVLSRELLKLGSVDAEATVIRALKDSVSRATDGVLLDPAATASADTPGSPLNGATTFASTGVTQAAFATDIATLVADITTDLIAPVFITNNKTAAKLTLLGVASPDGKTLAGFPLLRSAASWQADGPGVQIKARRGQACRN